MWVSDKKDITSIQVASKVVPAEIAVTTGTKGVPFFGPYFKIAYYLRAIPYQIKYDDGLNRWVLKSSKANWVSCILLIWIPAIAYAALSRLNSFVSFSSLSKRSANSYFDFGYKILNAMRSLYVLWIVVCQRKEMEFLINSCAKILGFNIDILRQITAFVFPDSIGHNCSKIIRAGVKRAQFYFLLVGIVYCAVILVSRFDASNSMGNWPNGLFQSRIRTGRRFLFLSAPSDLRKVELSAENAIIGILYIYGSLAFEVVAYFSEIVLMVPYPMTLWLATKKFEMDIYQESGETKNAEKETPDVQAADIEEKYEELKDFSKSLNACWGKMNFIWHLSTFLRSIFVSHGHNKHSWTLSRNWWLLVVLFQTICQTVALVLSADVFVKMENFKYWLTLPENWSKFWMTESRSKIERIYTELKDDPVGVSYNGLYHCNYRFIAQVLAFITTIFVVTFEKG